MFLLALSPTNTLACGIGVSTQESHCNTDSCCVGEVREWRDMRATLTWFVLRGKVTLEKKKKRLARIYLGWSDPIWESTAAANPLSRGFMALLEQWLGGAVGHPSGLRKGGEKYSQGRNEPAEGTQLLQLKQKIYTLEKSKIPQWHVIQMRVDWSHPVEGSF